MKEFNYVLTDENGIHARPAGILVREAAKFKSSITIQKDDKKADGKRLFSLMSLAAKKGDNILVTIEGEDEEQATKMLQDFLIANM